MKTEAKKQEEPEEEMLELNGEEKIGGDVTEIVKEVESEEIGELCN